MAGVTPKADPQRAANTTQPIADGRGRRGVKPKALGQHEQVDKAKQRPITLVLAALNGRSGPFNATRMGWLGGFVVGTPHVWPGTLVGKTAPMGANSCV